jgi:hypothetical protein
VTMVGFVVTSFFTGGRAPLALCVAAPPANTSAPTLQPTQAPTLLGNATATPTTLQPTTAPTNSTDDDDGLFYDDGNAGFVVMWTTLLLVALCISGTAILKSSRTPFAVGVFAGMVIVMSNLMFLLSASSAGELRRRALLGISTSGDQAILAFAVLEFMLLSAFSVVLIRHKDEVLEVRPGVDEMMDPRQFETTVNGARGI